MSADELPEHDALAAELALGLLEGEDRALALRRVLADPEFARVVSDWRDRLAPLFDLVPRMTPSADLWVRIEAALDGQPAPSPRAGFWKGATAAALAAAAALAGVLALRPAPPPQIVTQPAPPRLAAPLMPEGVSGTMMASYDPGHAMLRVSAETMPDDGRMPELWVIPEGGEPRSLGMIKQAGTTEMAMPAELKAWLVDGATLAVTLEPATGSPTGKPTGPMIASGTLTTV